MVLTYSMIDYTYEVSYISFVPSRQDIDKGLF